MDWSKWFCCMAAKISRHDGTRFLILETHENPCLFNTSAIRGKSRGKNCSGFWRYFWNDKPFPQYLAVLKAEISQVHRCGWWKLWAISVKQCINKLFVGNFCFKISSFQLISQKTTFFSTKFHRGKKCLFRQFLAGMRFFTSFSRYSYFFRICGKI